MRRALWTLLLSAAACGGEDLEAPVARTTQVVRVFEFARETPRGVSAGFDLDGLVSEDNDGRTCFKADFTAPDGTAGVDNELARLLPLIDLAGEDAVQGLIQNAVDEGRLLLFFEVTEHADGQVRLRMRRGDDVPLLGTDGRILSGQTLALHAEEPLLSEAEARFDGRVLEAGPFELPLPIIVFSQLYAVTLPEAYVRLELDADGEYGTGTLGGGIPVSQLVDVLDTASNFGPEFAELFGDAVRDSGDLARDDNGDCTQMSVAVSFETAVGFVWE